LHGAPASWAKVVAMRHAMTKFPDCRYLWYLDQNSLIMNPKLSIDKHLMNEDLLEKLMIKDHPVVPPDSIIKTFSHLRGDEVDFVLTQDNDGLSVSSFVVRNGQWGRYLLETWLDPIYRSYNFQKADTHALVSHFMAHFPLRRYQASAADPILAGAYRPVASNHPIQTCARPAAPAQWIQH
jgi:mannan polymerase II complex MNN11 subunit